MRKNILILAILVLPGIAFSQANVAPGKNFLDQNYIEVTGKATVKIVPDQIYLRIHMSEKQKNKIDLEVKEREMIARLKDIGIDVTKELVIKDMASNFSGKVFSDEIVIAKVYLLLVHDARTANRVISEMEKLEISNIRVDHLDHTKIVDYKKDCSIQAIKAAKIKAENLSGAIGQSIGRAVYAEEVQFPMMNESANALYRDKSEASAGWFATDLDFDEIKIDYSVMVRFELK
jgi:uncharacterized protein YggE